MSGLREAFDEIVADVPVYGDLDRAIRKADRERHRRYGAIAGLAAAAVVVAVVVGILGGSRDGNTSPEPASPLPTPTTPLTPPRPTTPQGASGPAGPWSATEWQGALRADQSALPVVTLRRGLLDAADAEVGAVDIRRVTATRRPEWRILLNAPPPYAWTFVPGEEAMEHGVVVDGDGDRVADCHIAISTDAPTPGDMRVRVTDLANDVTSEQVGPPYGLPIDFFHPSEGEEPGVDGTIARTVMLFFVRNHASSCEPFSSSAAFYTYAVLLEDGRPTATDFAPDDAWVEMP